jgi:hypothetical protein
VSVLPFAAWTIQRIRSIALAFGVRGHPTSEILISETKEISEAPELLGYGLTFFKKNSGFNTYPGFYFFYTTNLKGSSKYFASACMN